MPAFRFQLGPAAGAAMETASFADAGAARRHALARALDLLWDNPYRLHARPEWGVRVDDEAGAALFTVTLSEALAHDFARDAA